MLAKKAETNQFLFRVNMVADKLAWRRNQKTMEVSLAI